MINTYNIYKLKFSEMKGLLEKLESVGLVEQKTQIYDNYEMTFYFSEKVEGNDVWWHETYKDFLISQNNSPKNIFHFGLLICKNEDNLQEIYAVSLGKSHFYLAKFIEPNFGISLAVRMGNEQTTILKKSRYFTGTKRHEVSSYENFNINSYESGESVEHLKIKASNSEIWGDKNIIFADSVQLNVDKSPSDLAQILNEISDTLGTEEIIKLPKLEPVIDQNLITQLDAEIIDSLQENVSICLEEIHVAGINISFRFNEYNYELIYKKERKQLAKLELGNSFDISMISSFIKEHNLQSIDDLYVKFKIEGSGRFTQPLKEILDFYTSYEDAQYFLKCGKWFKFNETFKAYLKKSLEQITLIFEQDLIESDYLTWKKNKETQIRNGVNLGNEITYREYYFNEKLSLNNGYKLLDRQLEAIQSLSSKGRNYKFEVADLYKDNEIISVKISGKPQDLIYNIEQSKGAVELIKQRVIPFEDKLESAALWLVLEQPVSSLIEINSIQFLLAVDSWKKRVEFFDLKPKIYISNHIKIDS
ncbi:DUF6119 family protein [Acinetobacter sp. YH12140]|uniref:DUF6119 family protein n=1 Tax=Acinetobacter sp. YH12140 TaxID=2601124 RepID=UPI0015D3CA54|nr:DUF6119 family protein [Acinetobacter sp. YH12140]